MSAMLPGLLRLAPGLQSLRDYRREYFRHDLVAGMSVAAVALPVGVAYAELAGFDPVIGLYSSILPLLAYALFGSSRQLIVGPDAATCALVAAAVAPLAAGNMEHYQAISVALAFCAGLFCILGSVFRLGVLADFLSRPILVGFLNGIAISIVLGQIGKLFGFGIESGRIVPRLVEFISKLDQTHVPTLIVGISAFALLLASQRLLPRVPAALVVMALTALGVGVFGLEQLGVRVIGPVAGGLPDLHLPVFPAGYLEDVVIEAAGIALISFSSAMLTARSFAARNRYDIDVDREFAALGAANIASALSQGFAISGADSRTAMNDTAGGKTQVAGLVAAVTIAAVLTLFTTPLSFVPIAALGAVLVRAAWGLFDLGAMRELYRYDRVEFALCVLTMLGVATVGMIKAILVAIFLSILRFVQLVARPAVEHLGQVPGSTGFHSIADQPGASEIQGIVILRFDGPIVFFNANFFKQQLFAAANKEVRFIVLDAYPITRVDSSGYLAIREVAERLAGNGVQLAVAGRLSRLQLRMEELKVTEANLKIRLFSTLDEAVEAFRAG
ncbi:MAG: MFS transporter [Gammaproteobacteria bacterium RIFCSPLOWO2_02_FULL_61_13]|nr:MAG: MFS transporter [Gammaproteobacteria bacterium RIFCSPLOWO2_02_FULL_61_13]